MNFKTDVMSYTIHYTKHMIIVKVHGSIVAKNLSMFFLAELSMGITEKVVRCQLAWNWVSLHDKYFQIFSTAD